MQKIVLIAGLAIVVVIFARNTSPPPARIVPMPAFDLVNVNGGSLKSSELRGKVVVVDFWASWCEPCKSEIPKYNKLVESMAGKDFQMIGYAVESGDLDDVRKSAGELGIRYPVVMGTDEVTEAFGNARGLPTTFLVGKDGKIYKTIVGAPVGKIEQLAKDIEELLSVPYTASSEPAPKQFSSLAR